MLASISTRPMLSGPIAASTADGAKLQWGAAQPQPEVTADGARIACSPTGLRECAVSAARGTVLYFGASAVTAGAAPRLDAVELQEHPDECADAEFPAPLAGGMVGCSTPGVLDRHRRTPGSPRRQLKGLTPLASDRAALSYGARRLLIAQGRQLGSWAPHGATLTPSRELTLEGRPAGDGEWLLLPLSDRMQANRIGNRQRSQLPARPVADSTVVAGDWAAWVDRDSSLVSLTALASSATGAWPTAGTRPMLGLGWLLIATPEAIGAWGLQGQPGWSAEIDTTFISGPAWQDDIIAVPFRADGVVGTAMIHTPTGIEIGRLGTREQWVVPRGADADGLVVHARQPGARGVLRRHATPLRVLEEDGALGLRSNTAGGHGGRQLLLSAGESAETSVHCHSPSVLRAFRGGGPGEGTIVVTVAGEQRALRPTGTGWVDVIALPRETEAGVRFLADAAGNGFTVDALMLEARR